ncbi:NADPH-dependent FMN reductase [Flavobacterium flavigenum]|uniref:NADPH-dependent FMN reductase n=1 Tax=Flavobacterium flavigenum TaxID=3003258 RepID=UPI0022ABDC4D|nr:NAD(P)H-dependent oxidoreductase [Flavobacterium flavigenum]
MKIFAITGSTRYNSNNFKILKFISEKINPRFEVEIFEGLDEIPHFNPDIDTHNPPENVVSFRDKIISADGIIICTPEYIFSLPGSLKNAFEWCVSTTIFLNKPVGLITASVSGKMGHEELLLIMKTLDAKFEKHNQLLISGIKGKIDAQGKITNKETLIALQNFIQNFESQFSNELI